jgi:hypothetical protein
MDIRVESEYKEENTLEASWMVGIDIDRNNNKKEMKRRPKDLSANDLQ